ncbi:MAG: FAD-binding oxidoreductase, partial [Thermomonas haemolytica]
MHQMFKGFAASVIALGLATTAHAETKPGAPAPEPAAKVKQVTPLSEDILLLHLVTPRSQRLRFLAGHSVTLSVSGISTNFQGDYPIASCPCDDRNLLFHIRRDENDAFASRLFSDPFKPGDLVSVFGPFGEFVLQKDTSDDLLFIACDTGFAPIKSLIENAAAAD